MYQPNRIYKTLQLYHDGSEYVVKTWSYDREPHFRAYRGLTPSTIKRLEEVFCPWDNEKRNTRPWIFHDRLFLEWRYSLLIGGF